MPAPNPSKLLRLLLLVSVLVASMPGVPVNAQTPPKKPTTTPTATPSTTPTPAATATPSTADSKTKSIVVAPDKAVKLSHGGATIDIGAGALGSTTTVSVTALTDIDMPKLDQGMANVTAGTVRGYRFLPHNLRFKKNVKISLPYDPTLLPQGVTEAELRTHFLNDQTGTWQELDLVEVDTRNKLVVSLSDHFTDMVNAAVTVPEHAEALSFNPNTIKDVKPANPSAGVGLLPVPSTTQRGEASTALPIELPPGRAGMQPQLNLSYSSSAGNGWLGAGWDLSITSIGIDTRWGVPRYDPAKETETYTLAGEQLTPLAHRSNAVAREANKVFHARVETQFSHVVRHGTGPTTYWWEVTDKSGLHSYFGGTPSGGVNTNAVLHDGNQNIFRWALVETRDPNGNGVEFEYQPVADFGVANGKVLGHQLYLKSINYTQSNGAAGPYTVEFIRDSQLPGYVRRPDVQIDARGGFKMVTAELLKRVDISFKEGANKQLVRRYDLDYKEGAFRKTLLKSITQRGEDGSTAFPPHEFKYFDDLRPDENKPNEYHGFDGQAAWNTGTDHVDWQTGNVADLLVGPVSSFLDVGTASALGGSITDNVGGHIYVGFNPAEPTKSFSVGAKVGFGSSDNDTLLLLLDINGDHLPDKLFKADDGTVYFRLNQSGPDGGTSFGTPTAIQSLKTLGAENSLNFSFGAEVYAIINGLVNDAETFTTGTAYFADVNADGLPDLINGGKVLFNHLDNGVPTFTGDSHDTLAPIGELKVDGNGIVEDLAPVKEKLIDNFPLQDTLRRWVAPFDGTVLVQAPFHLIQDTSPARAQYETADGVRVAIQHNDKELYHLAVAPNDYSTKTPNLAPIDVKAGDRFYFRAGSVFDGKFDQVSWDPVITYTTLPTVFDVNNLDVHRYQAAQDFTLAGRRGISVKVPFSGMMRLSGKLEKLGPTSDNVTLQVIKNDQIIFSDTLIHSATVTADLPPDFSVTKGETIQLRVKVDSPIDVTKLKWNPDLFYVSVSDPPNTAVQDPQGKYLIQFNPPYDIDLYPDDNLSGPQGFHVATQDGVLTAQTQLTAVDPAASGTVMFTIKKRGALLAKAPVTVVNGTVNNIKLSVNVKQGDEIFFDYSAYDPELAVKLGNKFVFASYGDPGSDFTFFVPSAFHSATRFEGVYPYVYGVFPQSHRGWTVAGYNGNRDRATQAINENDLNIQFNQQTTYDPRTAKAYLFFPVPDKDHWRGPDDLTLVTKNSLSTSRLGVDFITVPTTQSVSGTQAVSRFSRTSQAAAGFGASVGPFSAMGSHSDGTSSNQLDYLDLNGDEFPDVVGNGHVQYTTPLGALEATNRNMTLLARTRVSENDADNIGVGGSAAFSASNSSGEVDTGGDTPAGEGDTGSQMVTMGLGGGLGWGDTTVHFDLLDVNGDGLPDRVVKNGAGASCAASLCVALNLGYGFADFEPWGNAPVADGASNNFSLNASLGFNGGIYDFAGGISLDKNVSHGGCESVDVSGNCGTPRESLFDLNGDGLLDRVKVAGSNLQVAFSTGNGFAPEVTWTGASGDAFAKNANVGVGGGVYFTIGVGPLCLAACYLIINPGADVSRNVARSETMLRDVDGDGYADQLASTADNSLAVGHNKTARTNLLREIKRPLGATISLDYQRAGNSVPMPHSRWTLARLVVNDGVNDDGVDTLTTFRYENGRYDRFEREFYGFGKVIQEQRDPAHNNNVYRSIVSEYRNDSYYSRGLPLRELTLDASNHPFGETEQSYEFFDVGAGSLPANQALLLQSPTATVFPRLVRSDKRYFEGVSPATKQTYTTNQYDALGNVIGFFDAGDTGTQDDLQAVVEYSANQPQCANPAHYIVGKPTKIVVTGAGATLRHRESTIDCTTGNLLQVRQFIDGATFAQTDLAYFPNGTLQTFTGPANKNGQRASVAYQYDPVTHTHATHIVDQFGLASSATYNLKHAAPTSLTDTNNNVSTYTYDQFGRLATLTGPYEQGGATPTIRFEYHPEADPAWALTRHFDPFRDASGADTIDTVTFVDGLPRVIQSKTDASLHTTPDTAVADVMVISGRLKLDFLGRTVEQFYPRTEPLGTLGAFNATFDNSPPPTVTQLDVLDRTTRITYPDGSHVQTSYGFGQDRDGVTRMRTTASNINDPNKIKRESFQDVRGLATAIKEFNAGQTLWTSYVHDPVEQLVQIRDDHNNLTTLGYDDLGRRTLIDSPDAGKTEVIFDGASNVIGKVTANLRAISQQVSYDYDFNRLVGIRYPAFAGNNVTYTFGASGAPDNRAGRITRVTDQSGSEDRFYGRLGELTKETKTVLSETGQPEVYTTQYVLDSFGRLQTMTYPDGEVLTYKYDAGGKVRQATGQKLTFTYPYLTRLEYDKFGARAFSQTSNGVRTQFTYDPIERRLSNMKSGKVGGTQFQNLNYTYDNAGNVLALQNNVPVPPASQFGGPVNQTFVYDDLYRLVTSTGTYQFAPDKTNRYASSQVYDTLHNIRTKTQTHTIEQPGGVSIPQQKTEYDFAYDYAGPHPHAPTHIDIRTYSYDANGNQTGWTNDLNGTRRTIVWDEENRVQSIFDNGHEKSYKYDDKGERVIKRGPQGETVYANQYFSMRNGAIGTKHIFAGQTRVTSKLVKKNEFEKDQFFYHADQLGSSNYVTDAAGALYEHLEYFPFGETWVEESSNTQRTPYLFTGKELDEETGLYYYGARYYDPRTSQFISTDPLLQADPRTATSMPAVLNVYAYVANNPLKFTDPTGAVLKIADANKQVVFQALQELADNTLVLKPDGEVGINITEAKLKAGIHKPLGAMLVWALIGSEHTTKIFLDSSNHTDKADKSQMGPTDVDLFWSPTESANEELIVGKGKNTRVEKLGAKNAFIGLGHELIHALRIALGIAAPSDKQAPYYSVFKRPSDGQMVRETVGEEEMFVSGLPDAAKKAKEYGKVLIPVTETGLRQENRIDPRAAYSTKDQAKDLKTVAELQGKGRKR